MAQSKSPPRILLAAALLASVGGCSSPSDPPPPPPVVTVSPPLRQQVTGSDAYTGRFDATDTVEVRPRVSGFVDSMTFRDGDLVRKGQLLFVIDPRPYRAAVAQAQGRLADARSQVALADADLARAKTLIASGTIAQSLLDQKRQAQQAAQAAVTTAAGALANAMLDLSFTEIRAPMTGRASRHLVSAGNLVQNGTTLLTTIVSTDPIDLYFDIDEESYLRYSALVHAGERKSAGGVGTRVAIALPGETKPSLSGTLDFADNRLDPSTGTLRARARVANPDGALKPGQFGTAEIEGDAPHMALLVPDSAIVTDATDKVLETVGAGNKIVELTVVPGRLFGTLREIRSGLKPQDRVVIAGMQHATPGIQVRPRSEPLKADPSLSSGDAQ